MLIDGGFGRLHRVRGPSLHFDETEHIFMPADQIDFSAAAGRAEVSGDHDVSAAAQIEVCVFFTAPASVEMGRARLRGRHFVGEPIEAADNGVGQFAGHVAILDKLD